MLLTALFLLLLLLVGCGQEAAENPVSETYLFTASVGRTVEIPKRIDRIAPSGGGWHRWRSLPLRRISSSAFPGSGRILRFLSFGYVEDLLPQSDEKIYANLTDFILSAISKNRAVTHNTSLLCF